MQTDLTVARLPGVAGLEAEDPDVVAVPRELSGQAKAAVIVRLLLNEGADIPLEDLPEDAQTCLAQQMSGMGIVDRVTLAAVVREFAEALDGVGLSFPQDLAGTLTALDGRISAQTSARLRREAGVKQTGDPWARVKGLDAAELAELARSESTEVAAVLLSKLEVEKAAAMLGLLPGPLARRITYGVSKTSAISPEAVERIGLSLACQVDRKPVPAFKDDPGERIGAILNHSAAEKRSEVLNALDETDAAFAARVRKSIFTFAHIPGRIAARDIPLVVRAVSQEDIVTALAAATDDSDRAAAEFLLSNISTRMADNLRDEVKERGKVKTADGEAAMTSLVTAIRTLVAAGEIQIQTPEEEDAGES